MQKIAADQIFDGVKLLRDQVLIIEEDGRILDLIPKEQAGQDVQKESGILCPGFINGHCHLELSHMKEVIPAGTGLVNFLIEVIRLRNSLSLNPDQKKSFMEAAEASMKAEGIMAVVDIANTADTAAIKAESSLFWHTCVELLGLRNGAEKAVDLQRIALDALTLPGQKAVYSPHAPYSVHPDLFRAINTATAGQVISIHNQESAAENALFQTGQSDFNRLYHFLGINENPIAVSGKNSLPSWLPYFNQGQTLILVHNTYSCLEDLEWANDYAVSNGIRLAICLCPRANLYIEETLPPINLIRQSGIPVLLGTDSLASNSSLSIAAEILTLQQQQPEIELEMLLHWATASAAEVIGKSDSLGSFQPGKRPGVLLLDKESLQSKRLY